MKLTQNTLDRRSEIPSPRGEGQVEGDVFDRGVDAFERHFLQNSVPLTRAHKWAPVALEEREFWDSYSSWSFDLPYWSVWLLSALRPEQAPSGTSFSLLLQCCPTLSVPAPRHRRAWILPARGGTLCTPRRLGR